MKEVVSPHRDFHIWQQARILDLTPVIVLDVLYMLFGVVGNSIVCYICVFRLQRTVINSFVLALAVLELLGCILTIPVDITELFNSYAFDFPLLCKTEKYFRKVIIFSTGCILVAIAAERYKRIVKPHESHMTLSEFRQAIVGAIVFSAVIAVPEAILSGNETIQTSFGTAVVCSAYTSDKFRFSVYPKLWGLAVVIIYVISITAISIIYYLVALQIWKRGKVHTDRRSRANTPDSTIQRRVRCYSLHHKGSEELDSCKRTRASFNCHPHLEQDLLSMYAVQNRNTSSVYHLCTLPRAKVSLTTEKSLHRIRGHGRGKEPKVDASNISNKYDDVNGVHKSGNTIMKIQGDYDFSIPPHSLCDSQTLLDRSDSKNTISNDTCVANQYLNNNCNNSCKEACTNQLTVIKDSKCQQETRNQSTAFIDAVINKLNNAEQIEGWQNRYRYIHENPKPCHHAASPAGTLHRKPGYSRKRTTFIMFVMTITTVFSHLPHIIVMLYSLAYPGAEANMSADECVIFRIAWNSFFLSLAAHPFMYGFWNGRFKSALCSLLTCFKLGKPKTEKDSSSSAR
ncbi:hypothetical protein BsWGS_24111 [Bradybaena similaris]